MPVRILALAVVPACLLSACTSYAPPRLSVTEAAVEQTSPAASVLRFTFDAENPNEVELPLSEIRYSVSLDGREVFRGVRSPETTLRRLGSQSFTVPAVLVHEPTPDATSVPPPAPSTYTVDGTLVYITPGSFARVMFDLGVRRPSVNFRYQGNVTPAALEPAPVPTPAP